MTPGLHFDHAAHAYTYLGRPLISVTQALKEAGLIDDRWYTSEAALRGTYIHEACAMLNRGAELHPDSLCGYEGEVHAYRCFLADTGYEPRLTEQIVMSTAHCVAGKIDSLGPLFGCLKVVDCKSGDYEPWHELQITAYSRMDYPQDMTPTGGVLLYLREDGTYRLREVDTLVNWYPWLSALGVASWKREHGILRPEPRIMPADYRGAA